MLESQILHTLPECAKRRALMPIFAILLSVLDAASTVCAAEFSLLNFSMELPFRFHVNTNE